MWRDRIVAEWTRHGQIREELVEMRLTMQAAAEDVVGRPVTLGEEWLGGRTCWMHIRVRGSSDRDTVTGVWSCIGGEYGSLSCDWKGQ